MTHTDAEQIETPKPPPFPEAWVSQVRYPNGGFDCYTFSTRERAESWSDEGLKNGNHRLLRLPSEHEAARSALVAAMHRAAVERCESIDAHETIIGRILNEERYIEDEVIASQGRRELAEKAYAAAKSALAEHDAKEKQ